MPRIPTQKPAILARLAELCAAELCATCGNQIPPGEPLIYTAGAFGQIGLIEARHAKVDCIARLCATHTLIRAPETA